MNIKKHKLFLYNVSQIYPPCRCVCLMAIQILLLLRENLLPHVLQESSVSYPDSVVGGQIYECMQSK